MADIEVLRLHYAETLKGWRQRFNANHERFCRMWEFYLAGCEAGFRHGGLVNFQIQLSKCVDAVPLTRNYISQQKETRVEGITTANLAIPVRRAPVNNEGFAK